MGRLETPRSRRSRDNGARATIVVAFAVLVMFIAAIATVVHLMRTDAPTETDRLDMHDSMTVTRTYNGEKIRWYVMVDPDTQVQYVVNDLGGCCPRLDAFGRPMGTQERGTD